jgi:hypothetical protein
VILGDLFDTCAAGIEQFSEVRLVLFEQSARGVTEAAVRPPARTNALTALS